MNVVPEFCSPAVWSVATAATIQTSQWLKMPHSQKYNQAGVPLVRDGGLWLVLDPKARVKKESGWWEGALADLSLRPLPAQLSTSH